MSFNGLEPKFLHRELSDTFANWSSNNPVVPDALWTYDSTNEKVKIGNGTDNWLDLPYIGDSPAAPVDSVNGQTGTVVLSKGDIGLGNVDNTSDVNKPISTATQNALNSKYDSSNPLNFQTLAQVNSAIESVIDSAPAALDTLNELAAALGDDENYAATIATQQAAQDTVINQEISDRTNADNALQANIDGKVNNSQVLTDVPTGAVFTDTVYDDTALQNEQTTQNNAIALNNAKVSFPEAPTDGQQYVRQNSAWSALGPVGSSPWNTNANGIDYGSGNVGVDTDNPIHNIQVGEQFNDTPGPARVQNTEIAQYAGTANNNGTAQIGLYESVPSAFPGDYGARIRYDAGTNLLLFTTVAAGIETLAFSFDRADQTATFNGNVNGGGNQAKNFSNATDDEDLVPLQQVLPRKLVATVTDLTTNINNANYTNNPVFGATRLINGNGSFTVNNDEQITCNFTGELIVNLNIGYTSQATRVAPQGQIAINGNPVNIPASTGYIRDTAGHNESSLHLAGAHYQVSNGDVISFQTQRESTITGAVTQTGGQVVLERIIQ